MSGPGAGVGPGRILAEILANTQVTRSSLESATGLSRPTVSDRLRVLSDANLIKESTERVSSGGRPATVIELNPLAVVILSIDIGESDTRVAVTDLHAQILAEESAATDPLDGPTAVLDQIAAVGRRLLDSPAVARIPLGAVGVSLPARVDIETGATVGWSVMVGWEGFGVTAYLGELFGVPAFVDNDVNLLMLAERHLHWKDVDHLFFIKIGTGVGGALIANGEISRGHNGGAGDIGHIYVSGFGEPICRCGNRSCLEAVAGGWALARDLQARRGDSPKRVTASEAVAAIETGDGDAVALVRQASLAIGQAAAAATNLINPKAIVIGGEIAQAAGHQLVAGVRAVVYQRSLPLATKDLEIVPSQLDEHGGVVGAALLAATALLDPARIDQLSTTQRRQR